MRRGGASLELRLFTTNAHPCLDNFGRPDYRNERLVVLRSIRIRPPAGFLRAGFFMRLRAFHLAALPTLLDIAGYPPLRLAAAPGDCARIDDRAHGGTAPRNPRLPSGVGIFFIGAGRVASVRKRRALPAGETPPVRSGLGSMDGRHTASKLAATFPVATRMLTTGDGRSTAHDGRSTPSMNCPCLTASQQHPGWCGR
jgi:hypothetical protein